MGPMVLRLLQLVDRQMGTELCRGNSDSGEKQTSTAELAAFFRPLTGCKGGF